MGLGGLVRDTVGGLANAGSLGPVLEGAWTGYAAVYHVELLLLLVTLVAIGPLARLSRSAQTKSGLGLAQLPR
jgi:BCD family chlorophyll transporter-like MFS transporter